jgi:SNF2 family DNA or RNA helicase
MQIEKTKYVAEPYQEYITQYLLDNNFCGEFVEMGLGKTVSTLTAIDQLFFRHFDAHKVLVIAPLLVAQDTWPDEIDKWDHLHRLKYVRVLGDPKQRIAALKQEVHIYLINYDNLAWLVAHMGGYWDFDIVVCDESSRLKSHSSKRFKALREIMPFVERCWLLTGTPMGNGYIDLWSQLYLLDKGKRLGKNISTYRNSYFNKKFMGWGYELKSKKHATAISEAIADICVSMRQKDYLNLPDRLERVLKLKMTPDLKTLYKKFEREKVLELMDLLESGEKITAINAAVLTNKLLQFANGAVYDADKNYHEIHDIKIEALREILESSTGHPVLVAYQFISDKDRILKHLAAFKPEVIGAHDFTKRWNAGEIPFALAHPASAGHGLNLQAGGHIVVFFGHTWSSELRKQFIARLERKGQQCSVIVTDLVLDETMDLRVLQRQGEKVADEDYLLSQVKALIHEYGGGKLLNDTPKYDFL